MPEGDKVKLIGYVILATYLVRNKILSKKLTITSKRLFSSLPLLVALGQHVLKIW